MDPVLAAYLRSAASRPFEDGVHDCGLWLADWYVARTGRPDPAAHLRGTWRSVRRRTELYGHAAILRQTRAIVRRLGLARVRAFEPGDIAGLRLGGAAFGAIRVAKGWALLSVRGLARLSDDDVKVIAAWRIS